MDNPSITLRYTFTVPTLGPIPEPRTFRSSSGRTVVLNLEYGRSVIEAERPIVIPSTPSFTGPTEYYSSFTNTSGMEFPNGMEFIVHSLKIIDSKCIVWVHPTPPLLCGSLFIARIFHILII